MLSDGGARTNAPRRRLSAGRIERVRSSLLEYSMSRRLDQTTVGYMNYEQSWYVRVKEQPRDDPYGHLAVHRVPLNNGEHLHLQTDCGDDIPGGPVFQTTEDDRLKGAVRRRLREPQRADEADVFLMVVEPVDLQTEWRGLGVEELLLCSVLAELQGPDDLLAAAEPVSWWLKGRARVAPKTLQHPIFTNIGFKPFRGGTWLLTDWSQLHAAHDAYRERFRFENWLPEGF